MKSYLATAIAVMGGAEALKHSGNMKQLFKDQLAQTSDTCDQSCSWTIDSIKSQANLDLDSVLKGEGKWTDNRFTHDSTALRWNARPNNYNIFSYTGVAESQITWARLSDHRSSSAFRSTKGKAGNWLKLFGSDGIIPHDIAQGRIGNCYLLAALASIAEDGDRFAETFLTKSLNDKGIVGWNLFMAGYPTKVYVDDYLPFRGTTSDFRTVYAGLGTDGSTWGALAEKLWAKLSNNYEATIAGNHEEIYPLFTGAPTDDYSSSRYTADQLWTILRGHTDANHIIGSGTPAGSEGGDQQVMSNGLHYWHAYSVLNTCIVTDKAGKEHRLVYARNPWRKEDYKGDWWDSDAKWEGATLEKGCERSTSRYDGKFHIPIEDFKTSFSWFNVNLASNKVYAQGLKVTNAGSAEQTFAFKTTKAQTVYVQFDTWGRRMIPKNCGQSSGGDQVKIMLYRKSGSRVTYTWSNAYFGQIYLKVDDLPAGEYEARITVTRWKVDFHKEYTVKLIASEDVAFTHGNTKSEIIHLLGDARTGSNSDSDSDSDSDSNSNSCSDCSECSDGSCSCSASESESESQSQSESESQSESNSDDNGNKAKYTQDRWNSYSWTNWGSCGACVYYMNQVIRGTQAENIHTTQTDYFKFRRGWYLKSRDNTWNMFYYMENTSDKVFDATIYVGGHVNGPFGSNGSNAYSYQRSMGGFIFRAKKQLKKGEYLAYMIKVNNEWLETHYEYVEV